MTFEVAPERPLAGGEAYVQYWGASPGDNWLAVAVAGAAAGDFIVRAPAPEAEGVITLTLPDAPNGLELQFSRDVGSGVVQLLGRFPFETARREVSIEAPETVENGTPLELQWAGEKLQGDHITIAQKADEAAEYLLCIPAAGRDNIAVTAPAVAGEYVIRYLTRRGRVLARTQLEIYEILATLDGPSAIAPGAEFTVVWTGPDDEQDFLSIAAVNDDDEMYQSFVPTADGNPTPLTAPKTPGDYEIRYVRATDGEVLARHKMAVVTAEMTIRVPRVVEAGTRFEVEWTGTPGDGDFVAVALPDSGVKNHLDWSFTNLGSPLTLAAPFEPGRYVVRYVSGTDQKIIAQEQLRVR
jgi:Ca-activated chloride channel family protein